MGKKKTIRDENIDKMLKIAEEEENKFKNLKKEQEEEYEKLKPELERKRIKESLEHDEEMGNKEIPFERTPFKYGGIVSKGSGAILKNKLKITKKY